jgi:hypothetical protein
MYAVLKPTFQSEDVQRGLVTPVTMIDEFFIVISGHVETELLGSKVSQGIPTDVLRVVQEVQKSIVVAHPEPS